MKNQKLITLLVLFGLLISTSCTKLEFAPENAQSAEDMYDTKEDFKDVLNSAYDLFGNSMNGTVQNFNELLGENLTDIQIAGSGLEYFAIYSRGTITFRTGDCFGLYQGILRVNTVMENLRTNKPGFTQTEIDQIEAECLFLRAWMHWEMVKLYAQPYGYTADNSHPGIPLRLVSTYEIELRSSVQKVYDQIIADLKIAESKLPLSNGNYANKWAAKGLLSKIYFQMHNYDQAFNYADDVIKQSGYTLSDSINRFNPGAESEIIFSIVSNLGNNKSGTFTGNYRSDQNPNPPFKISKEVIYKMFNDTLDKRKALYMAQKANTPFEFWVTKKFNRDVFNIPLIHLTDLYLIRAESFVEKGSKVDGYNDLMLIRNRSYGNGNRSFNPNASGVSVRDSIRLERRLEMIGEGDWTQQLKRMGSQGENITIRGAAWNCPGMILQFPASFKTEGFIFNKEGGCN